MSSSPSTIYVAAKAAKTVIVHAKGDPARIVAAGVAAGMVFVGVGIGYGIYRGGVRTAGWLGGRS